MIIERIEFRLKFGKAKAAIANWKEMFSLMKEKNAKGMRMLSDLSGHSYILVMEVEHADWKSIPDNFSEWAGNQRMGELYMEFIPMCDSSTKTYYKLEDTL